MMKATPHRRKKLIDGATVELRLHQLRSVPVPHAMKLEAVRRSAILERWNTAILGGEEVGMDAKEITARFVRTVQDRFGVVVSRSAIYRWDARFRRGGLPALIDRRKARYTGGVDARS
jgi:hypothetical protein